jgi:TolB-like protein/tetratricopeptide (TPR) repeat protein
LLTALLLLAGAAGLYTRSRLRSDKSVQFQPGSMAILPFRQIGTGNDELLGLGMSDALIFRLGNQKQIPVLPTSSMIKYMDRERDPVQVGRELGVHAVLDGTVQRSDDRVRVSVQLIDVDSGKPVWADRFDEKFVDIFTLQDAVSEHVSNALALKLSGDEKNWSEKRSTKNPEAYQSYVTAVYFWSRRSDTDLKKAIDYFKRATELDPDYALAYAGLADCYQLRSYYRYDELPGDQAYQRAMEPANKALAISPNLAEAYVARAGARYLADKPAIASIEADYKKAITLNPNLATARLRYGWFLYFRGELDGAITEMKLAQSLDPLSPTNSSALGSVLTLARQYDEALKYCRRAVELDPNMPLARMNLAEVYVQKGRYAEAIAEYETILGQEPQRSPVEYGLAYAYAASGQSARANQMLEEIIKSPPEKELAPYNVALVYVALGNKQKAFEWLGKIRTADPDISVHLRYDPQLDPIRNDPEFKELASKSIG